MAAFKNVMEIFKLLDKSNCRRCNEPTCLAFAAAVFQGRRRLAECPRLDPALVERCSGRAPHTPSPEADFDQTIAPLRRRLKTVDLKTAARRCGGRYDHGRLILKVMGKDVGIDANGRFYTDLHVHTWLAVPLLNYIIDGEGRPVSGRWVPFRELPGGQSWEGMFRQRCEKPLKAVADTCTDLFADMVALFGGSRTQKGCDADIGVALYPLPKVPLLVCYWRPEDDLDADLHIFFDDSAAANLDIASVYSLAAGLALMFEKLAQRHGG